MARGLGLVYAVAFASLTFQVVPLAGRRGLAPVAALMAAIRRDFTAPRRWLYFPGLLWFGAGDRWLRAIPWLGLGAALTIVAGGPHTPLAFLACYLLYLALDRAVVLVYPWDSLLLEAGFWAMFLPALASAPDLRALAAPLPALAWLFRLLLFRVMFGFGKQKFLGTTRADAGFLHGFMIRQPLPTPIGWRAHRAPMWVHKAALAAMFLVEIVLPFAIFAPGPASVVFALATAGLMLAIGLTGNYGFFNILTLVLCLVCLDSATALALAPAALFDPALPPFTLGLHALIVLHTCGALLCLPLNTWASFTWTLWPWWDRALPLRALRWPLRLFRGLQPLRWLHPYGVFPPRSAPAIKMSPALEVTWDEQTWHTLVPRYWPTLERCPPRFIAPHHPRFDHAIVYEATGFHEAGVLRNLTGRWDPYGHARCSGAGRLIGSILAGELRSRLFFGDSLDLRRGPPVAARVRMYMLEPTTPAEQRSTGRWWRRTLVGPHLPACRAGDPALDGAPPPPELWHPEDWVWIRRSRLGPLIRRAAAGEDPHLLVHLGAPELSAAAERLWDEFLPALADLDRNDWTGLPATVAQIRGRWSPAELDRFERLIGRHALLLMARCEPLLLDGGLAAILGRRHNNNININTYQQLGLLAHHIIACGRDVHDQTMQRPERAIAHLAAMTPRSGAFLNVVLRPERWAHQAQKLRMLASQVDVRGWPRRSPRGDKLAAWGAAGARRLWGAFDMIDLLRGEFVGDAWADTPERWPRFELRPDRSLAPIADPER